MKHFYLLILLACLVNNSFCQYVHPISSIDPSNTNFQDLHFLKEVLQGNQILGLGEQSHLDGASNDARVRLIKYLHEELGYNVIAFESGLYDCTKAYEQIKNRKAGDKTNYLFQAIFPIWHTGELQKLTEYIDSTQKTETPLILTGVDLQFAGRLAKKHLLKDFKEFIEYLETETKQKTNIDTSIFLNKLNYLRAYSNFHKKLKEEDTTIIFNSLHKIQEFIKQNKLNNDRITFWQQNMSCMIMDYRRKYESRNCIRDSMMALNLSYLVNNRFRNEKVMIWAANSHLLKSGKKIKNEFYKNTPRMGQRIRKEFKDRYYFMGLTAYEGRRKMIFKIKIPKPNPHGLEQYFYEQGHEYAYIDLRSFPEKEHPYFQNSALMGYYEQDMNVFDVMDGVLYIRKMYPSDRL